MSTTRRLLAVLGLALAVVIGSSIPAAANWSDTTALSFSASTVDVRAPGNVTGKLTCGSSTSTMSLTWTAASAPRISGYRVTVHFSDGYEQTENVGASATSWSKPISTYNVTAYSIRWSVTTLTQYGWTERSALTGSAKC